MRADPSVRRTAAPRPHAGHTMQLVGTLQAQKKACRQAVYALSPRLIGSESDRLQEWVSVLIDELDNDVVSVRFMRKCKGRNDNRRHSLLNIG